MFKTPSSFWEQSEIRVCPECGLEHAPIRSCEEAKYFHDFVNKKDS